MNHESKQDSGFPFLFFLFLIVFIPFLCVQKMYRKGRHAVVSTRLQHDDITLIALEEGNYVAIDATGCQGHLSPNPVATMDGGRRALYVVDQGYRLSEPWVTPKYVWVRKYDDGDVSHNAVYGVFRTPSQVQQWVDAHGYKGEFNFGLIKVREGPSPDEPYANANMPHYYNAQSQIETVIFTNRYAIIDSEVFESHIKNELLQIYNGVAQ